VPPLLLQPLVENAVRHGIEADGVPGLVRVALRRVGNSLEVEVHNSRTEAAGDTGRAGVGLRATRDRLALTYGGRATLETRAEPDSFAAILRLPLNDHA
jgi:LytS/YehU family sensor histidine kinase